MILNQRKNQMPDKTNEVPTWLKVVFAVAGFALLVWSTAWAASKDDSATTHLVSSHESRITNVEGDVKAMEKRQDAQDLTQLALQKDQQALLSGQREMKDEQRKISDLMIKKIESDAEIKAWIKTIDKVN